MRKYSDKIRRNPDYIKPRNYKHLKTVKEVAVLIGHDPTYIKRLEREGKVSSPPRIQRGRVRIRLYSEEHVKELQEYFRRTDGKRKSE